MRRRCCTFVEINIRSFKKVLRNRKTRAIVLQYMNERRSWETTDCFVKTSLLSPQKKTNPLMKVDGFKQMSLKFLRNVWFLSMLSILHKKSFLALLLSKLFSWINRNFIYGCNFPICSLLMNDLMIIFINNVSTIVT